MELNLVHGQVQCRFSLRLAIYLFRGRGILIKRADKVPRNSCHISAMRDTRMVICAGSIHNKAAERPQKQTAAPHRKMRPLAPDSNESRDPTKNGLHFLFRQDADAIAPFHVSRY